MQLCSTYAAGLAGVDGFLVRVEVSRAEAPGGLGRTTVVGLPDAAVKESTGRIIPALAACGISHGISDNVTINLSPGDRRKEGPSFDLAMALGLAASIPGMNLRLPKKTCYLAELALDGSLRPVRGALAAAAAARAQGLERIVVAPGNAAEAALVSDITVHAPETLQDFIQDCRENSLRPAELPPVPDNATEQALDLLDIIGQEQAKRVLAIAAAGQHALLMLGPPGGGKTMLARRLPGIMPPLSEAEALEVTRIHSAAGTHANGGLLLERPFRSPHHSASAQGLVGGGRTPSPGEVSLAHRGVLFLDELAEFKRSVLEQMRQPLEDGSVTISRAGQQLRFPSRCQLVAAMNPCPCGWLGHPTRACTDNAAAVHRYRSRISGPLLDRIDLHLEVPAIAAAELAQGATGPDSATIRAQVAEARARMIERQGCANGELGPAGIRRLGQQIGDDARALLVQATEALGLSARAHDRILKVARSIADLDGADTVSIEAVSEAIGYRLLDRATW